VDCYATHQSLKLTTLFPSIVRSCLETLLETRTRFSRYHELLITQGSFRECPRLPPRAISAGLTLALRAWTGGRTGRASDSNCSSYADDGASSMTSSWPPPVDYGKFFALGRATERGRRAGSAIQYGLHLSMGRSGAASEGRCLSGGFQLSNIKVRPTHHINCEIGNGNRVLDGDLGTS